MGVCTDAGKWHCHRARSPGKRGRAEWGEGVPEEEEAELVRDIKNRQRGNERAGKSPQKGFPAYGWMSLIVGFCSALLNGCGLKPYMNLFYLFTSGQLRLNSTENQFSSAVEHNSVSSGQICGHKLGGIFLLCLKSMSAVKFDQSRTTNPEFEEESD